MKYKIRLGNYEPWIEFNTSSWAGEEQYNNLWISIGIEIITPFEKKHRDEHGL